MSKTPYTYNKEEATRYRFTSRGRKNVVKVVEFTPLFVQGFYNLGFGDLSETGFMSDRSVSNNGDILKVLSTVIDIIKDFTLAMPNSRILFTGSTVLRTTLYQRVLKTYFTEFTKNFVITAIQESDNQLEEVMFDPWTVSNYKAFIIQRKV